MVNRLIKEGEAPGSPRPADYPVAYNAAKQLDAIAAKRGSHEFAAQWAGQGAPLARELPANNLSERSWSGTLHAQNAEYRDWGASSGDPTV